MDELTGMNLPEEPVLQEESPAAEVASPEKFRTDSVAWMRKICDSIKKLEGLADKKGMVYTEEDVDKMFNYLASRLDKCKGKYLNKLEEQKGFDFTF